MEVTPPATPETDGSLEDVLTDMSLGENTGNTSDAPIETTSASTPASDTPKIRRAGDNGSGDVVPEDFAGEEAGGSLGGGIVPDAAPDPPPSGKNIPLQGGVESICAGPSGEQQAWNWQGDDWLDEDGVATGPADWLDEDGIATSPEGWFHASTVAAARSRVAGYAHEDGVLLETIPEDMLEDREEYEGVEETVDTAATDVLIGRVNSASQQQNGDGWLDLFAGFDQQDNGDSSFFNIGGIYEFLKAVVASLVWLARFLHLDVIDTLIFGREADQGCVYVVCTHELTLMHAKSVRRLAICLSHFENDSCWLVAGTVGRRKVQSSHTLVLAPTNQHRAPHATEM